MTTSVRVSFGSVNFTGEQIKEARIIEQVSPLSTELPSSTLSLGLFSDDDDFSIVNPSGFYANLQYRQPLDVYETIDGVETHLGMFYLDKWESLSEREMKIEAIDIIGVLDGITFLGGIWGVWDPTPVAFEIVAPITADDLVSTMLGDINVSYTMDTELESFEFRGWIPICSYREALQQIVFAMGAHIALSATGEIQIRKTSLANNLTSIDSVITAASKGHDNCLALRPLVTGVEVNSHEFLMVYPDAQQLHGAVLSVGTHRIYFSEPIEYVNIDTGASTGTATIADTYEPAKSWSANYCTVNVTVSGTIVITGVPYAHIQKAYGAYNNSLPAGTPSNIVTIADATLVDPPHAATVSQAVFNYYQQRYLQKVRFYALPVSPDDAVLIAAQSSWITGFIERMDIDLTGGFVQDAEIVGILSSECDNVLTADTIVPTGSSLTYVGCLDMLFFNLTLEGTAQLIIN
jgi:hypothetical protein